MATGVRVIGDSGATQIDETYRNLHLRQKGTAVTTNNLSTGSSWMSFNVSGLTSPIIAIGGGTLAAVQTYWDVANARHGFLISANGGIGTSVPYYIFDVPRDGIGSTFGFKVRDAAGVLVFDALQQALRVRGFYPNQSGNISNLANGRVYAVAHLLLGFRAVTIETLFVRMYSTQITATGFNVNLLNYSPIPAGQPQTNVRLPTLMAIDVTSY